MKHTHDKTFLPNSRECFVCGENNQAGLGVRFYIESGIVKVRWNAHDHHCGYKDTIHGGITAAVMDECMGWAASQEIKRMCVTAELNVRYLRRAPQGCDLTVTTEIDKITRRIVYVKATLHDDNDVVYAKAEGRFAPLSVEETLMVDDNLVYRKGDLRMFDSLREEHLNSDTVNLGGGGS